ncbi:ABC transporter ATP-binding protein [Micromonospora endophytica]|uniref:ABC transporter ATP-binding protein n=1 Tax=Micromonospora endophytica TaxID=515350 RepID=A0A2W2D948_9ACTN|nr:ABC transporter ATP-binding protein [Micromonospora endophytica]PZF93586.1 ABC transporter ATP-binding protein [Micromonospora endophytica]RIW49125.1 ABC transporter ATP-binding protein [Micromonospora endophytica]BCJ59119.1 ABC transporter ATP-binding protein [Micromonospora endophytica]
MTQLQARGLVRSYGPTPALRGITMEVAEGEIVAVTGPSGCGKSTLLHCLAGILRPDAGEVAWRGHRIDTWSEAARSRLRRTEFGVLFQFGQLVAELTAAENVALPLLLAGTGRRAARTAALTWLDRFGVAELADVRPGEMSGGQQQRCATARALVTEPRVLFADEPTGSLDTLTGEQVLTQLVRLAREQRTTVVLITHEPRIAAYADREIVLRDGVIDHTGLGLDAAPVTGGVR